MRSRAVCFTSWDPLQLDPTLWASCTFAVWQQEVCPDTGKPHWQGYAEFDKAMRFNTLHTYDGFDAPKAHFEMRRGTQAQAIAYCTKEDTRVDGPWEFGEPKNQGQRQDLMNVKVDIDRGYCMKRVADEHFPVWTKYHAAFRAYKRMQTLKRDWPMEIFIILGPSGCGKTRFARDAFPNAYWKPHGKWFDNYDGQDVVVIDEMYGNRFAFTDLLNLMDRYPHSVECKGGTIEFTSRTLVFTSNQEPEDWYDPQRTHQHMAWRDNPLKRRIDEFAQVIYMGSLAQAPLLAIIGPVIEGQPRLGAE
nr:MAG: replication associated protein [Cressdnaviricota sp.]